MSRVRFPVLFTMGCALAGIGGGAFFSTEYWGYAFARPATPEVMAATHVLSVTSLQAARRNGACTLDFEPIGDLGDYVAAHRKYVDEFPYLRALVGLADRGLLPPSAQAPGWLRTTGLYQAAVDAGVLVRGESGYDHAGCFGGYAFELRLPSGETRLLLTAAGPAISNDHHPYYEVLFRREGERLVPQRSRVWFFDIAGLEGLDWPVLHCALAILSAMLGLTWLAIWFLARRVASWIQRRPTMACT